jgi:hypothetical protein
MTVGRIPSVEGGIQPTLLDAKGDLITSTAADTPARLALGTTGQVLKVNTATATGLEWATDSAGMTNPMTTTGDTIYSSSGSTPARLGIGSTGQVLTVAGGLPSWATPESPTFNWTSYTPSFTGLTVGNGTIDFQYAQVGKVIFVNGAFTLGSTSSVSSNVLFTFPVTAVTYPANAMLGSALVRDAGTANYSGNVVWSSTTQAILFVMNAAGTYTANTAVTNTIPMTWTNTDYFTVNFFYEAA